MGVRAGRQLGQRSGPRPGRQAGDRGFQQARAPRQLGVAAQYCRALVLRIGVGALYGILAGSLRRPRPVYGVPFGAAVWITGYLVLPEGGLYKPIWEYDAETLAIDLTGHLAYGAGTGTVFWLFTKTR